MRLLHNLVLLSAASAMPIVGVALLATGFFVQSESENLISTAKARNRATLAAVDAEIRGTVGTLQALSSTSSLVSGDFEAFHHRAGEVLASQPSWQNMLLTDRDGRQIVNARLPWGTPLLQQPAEPRSIEAAIATRKPAVGDLNFAPRLGNEPGISVRVPIAHGSEVTHVLSAVLSVASFQQLLASQGLPSDWVTGIVDNNGRLIARLPPTEPGKQAGEDYLRHTRASAEGWFRGRTLEGKDTFTAYSTSALTGWSIGYAIPAATVLGGATRAAWVMGGGIALSVLAAAVIAVGLSRRIAKPLSELADAAAALPQQAQRPQVVSNIAEVRALAAALAGAGRTLAARDRELSQSSEELRKQAAALRQADANKSRFLALLAHELRNPLAPLRYGLEILKRTGILPYQESTRAMMERQVVHMARLIDDLLDVSRIDRGLIELQRERVALDPLVANAIESVAAAMEAKHQELVVRYAPGGLHVDGDPVRVIQVISNILQNASKFSPPGGCIEIATQADGAEAVLTVKDSGIGFDPASSARIFEVFMQLDDDQHQARGGLGIGLSIVKSMVEMHGGSVRATSDGPGKGSTFEVRLPLSRTIEQAGARESAAPALPAGPLTLNRRILIADDNLDAAESMAEILRQEGFEVRTAFDGVEALRMAREFKPDVAFVDLHMPGLGGVEVARNLKSEPWAAEVRLIALTGMGTALDIVRTQASGFDAHLIKPAALEEVLRWAHGASNVVPLFGDRQRSS
jgi:signal transduction histidine kinase/CheY-like chemotaxis protein